MSRGQQTRVWFPCSHLDWTGWSLNPTDVPGARRRLRPVLENLHELPLKQAGLFRTELAERAGWVGLSAVWMQNLENLRSSSTRWLPS